MSYTRTCEIPGITCAGAGPGAYKYTPPCDAELIHYGYCLSGGGSIPATPDGKPTPALLTKAALESASIPHMVVNAGSAVAPELPYVETGMPPGGDVSAGPALGAPDVVRGIERGRILGRTLSSLADCLVIGESLPGGTTTALAVTRGLGGAPGAPTSSSMPENPVELKERVAAAALRRIAARGAAADPFAVAAEAGDPMIPVAAGMLAGAAAGPGRVILAGGTQMAAVLALGKAAGFDAAGGRAAVCTTSYVADDPSADLAGAVRRAAGGVPVMCVDPGLAASRAAPLRAYSEGFAKEGAGAGGCMAASLLRTGSGAGRLRGLIEAEYARAVTRR